MCHKDLLSPLRQECFLIRETKIDPLPTVVARNLEKMTQFVDGISVKYPPDCLPVHAACDSVRDLVPVGGQPLHVRDLNL